MSFEYWTERCRDPTEVNANVTRGACNVLLDLVTALASDGPPTVLYALLDEADLELDVRIAERPRIRARARRR